MSFSAGSNCRTFKKVCVVFAVAVLPGCALIGEPVAEKVAEVIDRYCEEPYLERLLFRETINDKLGLEGHSIEVICFGDPE